MASHTEVAHRWALDDETKRDLKSFNMFAEWSNSYRDLFAADAREHTIFSHGRHFPIAAFQTTKAGERVVLMTTKGYSNSTLKHKLHTWRAIPSRYRTFNVENVSPSHTAGGAEHFHRDNLDGILKEVAESTAKASRARLYKASHLERANARLRHAREYAATFELGDLPADVEAVAADLERRALEAAETYRIEREARAKVEAERMASLRAEQSLDFAAWLDDLQPRCPSAWQVDELGGVAIRRHVDHMAPGHPATLQTARGATVPWAHAVKAFKFIKLCRERGEGFHSNGRSIRVGDFKVDSIDAHGNMTAGCHYFSWSAIEACAKQHGVFDEAPSEEAVT